MVSATAATVLNTVVLAAAYPLYLHFLGYEKYGVWLVLTTVLSFAQLGDLGISHAVMKLVAEEYGRGDLKAVQQYIATAVVLLTTAGAAALTVILTYKTEITEAFRLTGENAHMALWLLPYVAFLSVYVFIVQVLNAALSGLGRMDLANWAQLAGRIAAVTAAGSLLYAGYGIEGLLIGHVLSYVLLHGLTVVLIKRVACIRFLQLGNLSTGHGKRLLTFGLGPFGGSMMNMLLSPLNKLMLSRYAGVSTIAVYEITYGGSMHIRALIAASLRALVPEVSRIGATMTEHARARISRLNHRAIKAIFLFGLPVYAGLFTFSTFLFRVWLRERYVDALPDAFRIMLVATFINLVSLPAYYTLLGLGRVRYCFYWYAIQAVTNALVVVLVVAITGGLSVVHVVCAVLLGMLITSVYIICQNHSVLKAIARPSPAGTKVVGLAGASVESW